MRTLFLRVFTLLLSAQLHVSTDSQTPSDLSIYINCCTFLMQYKMLNSLTLSLRLVNSSRTYLIHFQALKHWCRFL